MTPFGTSIPKSFNKEDAKLLANMTPAQQWANTYFHMTPTVASLAILSKFQNDIRNSQNQLIEYCYRKINSTALKLPEFGVVANPSATLARPHPSISSAFRALTPQYLIAISA